MSGASRFSTDLRDTQVERRRPDRWTEPITHVGEPPPSLPSQIRIEVVGGPTRGASFTLGHGCYRVGKHPDCHVVVCDPQVSRVHLELSLDPTGIHIRDLGSRNGSYYKKTRFSDVVLPLGASIVIGASKLRFLSGERVETVRFGGIAARSRAMLEVFRKLERVAQSDANVLVTGETGTGKEVVASALHRAGPRRERPFVVCDLAAMPRSIIESELFGHVRGAFTGADRDREGAFERANGGTILLDEIGELPLEAQPVLLRVIENRTIQPIGSSKPIPIDVRIIAATNRDLAQEVERKRFRADLFFRLSAFPITVPPLRDRLDDIPLLVESMLGEQASELTAVELAALADRDWPGNVRELRNELERMLAFSDRLDFCAIGTSPTDATSQRFREARASWERQYLERVLGRTDGNVSQAAREAGLGRTQMYQLMKKYGI